MGIEAERLVAYFEGDLSNLRSAKKEADRIFDSLENRIKNLTSTIKIDTKSGSKSGVDQAMRDALSTIEKYKRENAKAEQDITKNTEREEKTRADIRAREARRSANDLIKTISQINKESENAANSSKNVFSSVFSGSFFGSLAGNVTSFFLNKLAELPGKVKDLLGEMTDLSEQRANALKGLSSTAEFKGIDSATAQESVKNLRLVKAGILDITDAATAYKSIAGSGFTDKQSVAILERFSDAAAFGKQQALTFGEAISRAGEGIKNQNSALVDNVGLTKNLSVILKERGYELQDLGDKQKGQNALLALYNGIIEETKGQVGDADKLTQGYTGSTAALEQAQKNLYAAYGDLITQSPEMREANKVLTEQINEYTSGVKDADSETGKFSRNAVSRYAELKGASISLAASIVETFKLSGLAVVTGVSGILVGLTALVEGALSPLRVGFYEIETSFAKLNNLAYDYGIGVGTVFGRNKVEMPSEPEYFGYTRNMAKVTAEWADAVGDSYKKIQALGDEYDRARERIRNSGINFNTSSDPNNEYSGFRISGLSTKKDSSDTSIVTGGKTSKAKKVREKTFKAAEDAKSLIKAANMLGISPLDLAAIISYETSGTFSTSIKGGKGNKYQGLIQFGEAERKDYGVSGSQTFERQLIDSVVPFFKDRFAAVGRITAGATLLDLYKTVNGGNPNVSSNASDGNGTIASHVKAIGATHRKSALNKFFGGDLKNITGVESFSNSDLSDAATNAQKEKNLRAAIELYKIAGLVPSEEMLSSFRALMAEDAKKAGTVQPNQTAVAKMFADVKMASESPRAQEITLDPAQKPSSIITPRQTPDEEYISGLRESLGLKDRYTKLLFAERNLDAEISTLVEDRNVQLREAAIAARQEYGLLQQRNITEEISVGLLQARNEQTRQLGDVERDLGIFRAQNADAEFVRNRRLVSVKSEQFSLEQQIAQLQDEVVNGSVNEGLRVQVALLQDILQLRDLENQKIIESNRTIQYRMQVQLAQLPSYGTQIKDFFGNLPTAFGDMFAQGLQSWDGTFKGFLKSVTQSFAQMLRDLAAQMLRSAIIKLVTNLLGSVFGGGSFGPSSGIGIESGGAGAFGLPGLASGGTAIGGMAHIVGERGPEIFVPGRTGTVINNRDTQKLLAEGAGNGSITNVTLNQTIHAPRGIVAPKSARQAADAAVNGLSGLTRGKRN